MKTGILALSALLLASCADDVGRRQFALDGGPISDDGGFGTGGDIEVTPTSVNFGEIRVLQYVSQMVTVQNSGNSTLTLNSFTLSSGAPFSQSTIFAPVVLAPGGTYQHTVGCQPTGVGNFAATLTISSSDLDEATVGVPLTCRGVKPDILVSPTMVNFGGVPVGNVNTVRVTISNDNKPTTSVLSISGMAFTGTNATDFTKTGPCANGCTINPAGSTYVDLMFAPAAVGSRSGNLRIVSNDVETQVTDVPLSGTGQQQNIQLAEPTGGSLAFGDVNVGQTSSPQTVKVRNDGNLNLTVTGVSIIGAGASSYAVSSGPMPPLTVTPASSLSWEITCSPTSVGAKAAIFRVASNDPDQPNTDVSLSCNGAQSSLFVNPSPVSFGTHRVGASPAEVTVNLTNTGGGSLTISALNLTGASEIAIGTAPALPVVLSGGGSTSLTLTFAPSTSSAFSALLSIVSTDPNSPTNVAISGTGVEPAMEVTPSGPVDLGPVCVGLDTDTPFSIASAGTGPFQVQSITASPAAYTVDMVSPALPATLDGTSTLEFRLRVRPGAAGAVPGTLSIATDLPGSPLVIDLAAVGIAAGLATNTQSFNFGTVAVGSESGAQELSLTNCSASATVTLTAVDLTGGDAIGFRIDNGPRPPPDEEVPRTETRRWDLVFQPMRGGSHVAAMTISTSDGEVVVPLSGTATDDNPDAGPGMPDAGSGPDGGTNGADGDNTYYACAAGGTGSAPAIGLVALALLAVTGRRRRRS